MIQEERGQSCEDFDHELTLLLEAIYLKYGHDFRSYAQASLKRRLQLLMSAYQFNNLSQVQERVFHDPPFFRQLMQFLTVQVSDMFRDPAFFLAFRTLVVPYLKTYPFSKIWIAGCASGEEVYSLAIILEEEKLLEHTLIYATDINSIALEKAKRGIFPLERMKSYTQWYQESGGLHEFSKYYVTNEQGAIFNRRLRENVVFAEHNLSTDGVFSETHFISCRNVLIYFSSELQKRALGLFRDSLRPGAYLGLGPKESIRFSGFEEVFQPIDVKERIFRVI